MIRIYFFLLFIQLFIFSCSPKLIVKKNNNTILNSGDTTNIETNKIGLKNSVLVFEPYESELFVFSSPEIAKIKIVATESTNKNCDYESIVNLAIIQTLSLGGNCLRIDNHIEPLHLSNCHQIWARVYKLENIEGYTIGKIHNRDNYIIIKPSTDIKEENKPFEDFYFQIGTAIQAINTDYSKYSPYIGEINTTLLNQNNAISEIKIDFGFKKSIFGIGFGYNYEANSDRLDKFKDSDSISRNISAHLFELSYAYKLLYYKYFNFFPKVSFKYFRERLRTSQKDGNISLENLTPKNDQDLRFNYIFAFLGTDICFKFFPLKQPGFSIGCTPGYLIPINAHPFMYSHSNRITNNPEVKIENLFFTINLGIIFL